MTTILLITILTLLSINLKMFNLSEDTVIKSTAQTERSIRRLWIKCTEAEETNRKIKKLILAKVGTATIEEMSRSKTGRAKWVNRGEGGRKQVVLNELETILDESNCKVKSIKQERKSKTFIFKNQISHNIFRRKMSKILATCKVKREQARRIHDESIEWLKKKYGGINDEYEVPSEASKYEECKIFKNDHGMKPEEPSGPVVVCDVGEDLKLSDEVWAVLARGPKYCVVRGCNEEDARVEIETSILKHKWDCMSQESNDDEDDKLMSDEEKKEVQRCEQLAEEMAAQTRMVYDGESNTVDARGLRVTDYKHNSRVIFPKAQDGEKENNLEVMRAELLHQHREWVKANCNCKNEQKSNLSSKEQAGLRSIKKMIAEGELVILPTDKSGRFGVMSMNTYIKAGMVHIKDDEQVGIEERKSNQKILNGAVSMMLKIFRVGKNSRHEGRWRESMMSNSLEACPLWLLFKDHKNWTSSKGTPPPTRPVMGGNGGMNAHLSEILSWLLEPLANSMIDKSSEVISDEHLKNKIDTINLNNKEWVEADPNEEPEDSNEMDNALGAAPSLCGCEECIKEGTSSQEGVVGESSRVATEAINEGGGRVIAQTGSMSNNVYKEPTQPEGVAGKSSRVATDLSQVQYVTTSVAQRGNRNRALLLRDRRAALKERRTTGYARCNKVNSKEVSNNLVQDRTRKMVIIGSDAVSLYPSMTKVESADEVASAVLESSIKWEGINWKEATRFLVLGRDETWCRGSKLWRVLPRRKFDHGTKPGLTGAGPMGANTDDENQWQFRKDVYLTEQDRKHIMAEVLRLAVEIMFDTHIYTFGGHFYKQKEGGPIGLRSTCALARVVMARWDIKWKNRVAESNIQVEDDGRFVDDARNFLYPLRPGWRWEQDELWFSREWEQEDQLLSPIERTKRAVFGSMQGIVKCLAFTVETEEDFQDGWLPTLDFKLRVNSNNVIEYAFFEKPMASNQCLQTDTALNQNCMIRSLSNEVIRRLDAFNETVSHRMRIEALDIFCQKMLNSGHKVATIRSILVSGIKGYDRKVARCQASGIPLHRSAAQSSGQRRTKKLLVKTQWFRQEGKEDAEEQQAHPLPARAGETQSSRVQGAATNTKRVAEQGNQQRITTVLFVEFTRGGDLQKKMRETLDRIQPMLGFRVRVAEKGGTNLESVFSNKNLWKGKECGRHNCRTCAQAGEQKEPCTLRNVVYESECARCNKPGERKEQDKISLEDKREVATLYVGETARSISERASEHWRDGESMKEESHMNDHQQQRHVGEQPKFNFRVVRKCQSSLERQVRESVRILMRGNVLNRKGTYNRCKLTRLVVDGEWESKVWQEAWEQEPVAEADEECLIPKGRGKKRNVNSNNDTKRIRIEAEDEGWGNGSQTAEVARSRFLYEPTQQTTQRAAGEGKQATLMPMRGVEWIMHRMVLEVASMAVTVAELTKGAESWAEWVEEEEQVSKRTRKEEEWLWRCLEESDREQAKAEKLKNWKRAAKVEKARKKMGAKSSQPSIVSGWVKRAGHGKSSEDRAVKESSTNQTVNTLSVAQLNNNEQVATTVVAVSVAQLKHHMSNIVKPDASLVQWTGAVPQPVVRVMPQPSSGEVASIESSQASKMSVSARNSGECGRDECVSEVRNVSQNGVQASQSNITRCTKKYCLCTSQGAKSNCQEGSSLVASESKFGPRKISKRGRGVTRDGSLDLSLTSSPKHTFKNAGACTPIKRKLVQQQNVSRLISTFEHSVVPDTHWGEQIVCSPAKRRKRLFYKSGDNHKTGRD